jgi:hypothetical protein
LRHFEPHLIYDTYDAHDLHDLHDIRATTSSQPGDDHFVPFALTHDFLVCSFPAKVLHDILPAFLPFFTQTGPDKPLLRQTNISMGESSSAFLGVARIFLFQHWGAKSFFVLQQGALLLSLTTFFFTSGVDVENTFGVLVLALLTEYQVGDRCDQR